MCRQSQDRERDDPNQLGSPRGYVPEVGHEGQVKTRDGDENGSVKICSDLPGKNLFVTATDPAVAKRPITAYQIDTTKPTVLDGSVIVLVSAPGFEVV